MPSNISQISVVFFGTPHFALESLIALRNGSFNIRAVVTQPDKPSGRGQILSPPPVKEWAVAKELPVFQPGSIRNFNCNAEGICSGLNDEEGKRLTVALSTMGRPDFLVVVAYGKILPPPLLSYSRIAAINVHASILPRWRGAAPIQRALLTGDRETGICIMRMEEGLDTGPVYAQRSLPIEPSDNFGSLHDRLATLGGKLLVESLPAIALGKVAVAQNEFGVTYAKKWEKQDTIIKWEESAELVVNRIRACSPQPGARTRIFDEVVKITQAHVAHDAFVGTWKSGTIVMVSATEIVVSTGGSSFVAVKELQFPGRKRLAISEILKGREIPVGERFKVL